MEEKPTWWTYGPDPQAGDTLALEERETTNEPTPSKFPCFARVLQDGSLEPVVMRHGLKLSLSCKCHPDRIAEACYEVWTLEKPGYPSVSMLRVTEWHDPEKRLMKALRDVELAEHLRDHPSAMATVL